MCFVNFRLLENKNLNLNCLWIDFIDTFFFLFVFMGSIYFSSSGEMVIEFNFRGFGKVICLEILLRVGKLKCNI